MYYIPLLGIYNQNCLSKIPVTTVFLMLNYGLEYSRLLFTKSNLELKDSFLFFRWSRSSPNDIKTNDTKTNCRLFFALVLSFDHNTCKYILIHYCS